MFAKKKKEIHIHSLSPMLSDAIRHCRTELNMSMQDLALKIRKPSAYVNDLEQGKIPITSQALEDCASSFGISVGELVEIAVSDKTLPHAQNVVNTKRRQEQANL